jgi:hypothetical protein
MDRHQASNDNATNNEKVKVNEEFLNILKNKPIPKVDSPEQLISSIYRNLTELIWMELALEDLIKFMYFYDEVDGDHFGPVDFNTFSETEYLMSPGYVVNSKYEEEDSDWIDLKYGFSDEDIENFFNTIENDEWEQIFTAYGENIQYIAGLRKGESLKHVKLNESFSVNKIFEESDGSEEAFYMLDIEVLPNKSRIKSILNQRGYSYTNMSELSKKLIIESSLNTLNHEFLGNYEISFYLLKYLKMHPATPNDLKALIELSK